MSNFTYANGRAKALEKNLLNKDRISRMIESTSISDALKVLSEVNFGKGIPLENTNDFDKLIDAEEKALIDFIKEVGQNQEIITFFLAKYDYNNAEAIIKSKYLKADITQTLKADGVYSVSTLKEKIMIDDYRSFSQALSTELLKADNMFVNGKATGQEIDLIFKKALYEELYLCSRKLGDLKRIYNTKADTTNIAIAIRTRNFSEAKEIFVDGGKLKLGQLKIICEESPEIIKDKIKDYDLRDFIDLATASLQANSPLSDFEKLSEDFSLNILMKDKYSIEGNVPFLLYCYYKFAELTNVRIIMVCLKNNVQKNVIKEKIRRGYEG